MEQQQEQPQQPQQQEQRDGRSTEKENNKEDEEVLIMDWNSDNEESIAGDEIKETQSSEPAKLSKDEPRASKQQSEPKTKKPEEMRPVMPMIPIIVATHSNFRSGDTYTGPADLVGVLVAFYSPSSGDRHGRLFRVTRPLYLEEKRDRERYAQLPYIIFRDKFCNERNWQTLTSNYQVECTPRRDTVEECANELYTLVARFITASVAPMDERDNCSPRTIIVHHHLPHNMHWLLRNIERSAKLEYGVHLRFETLHNVSARTVMISPPCIYRENHNSVTCEVCVFEQLCHGLALISKNGELSLRKSEHERPAGWTMDSAEPMESTDRASIVNAPSDQQTKKRRRPRGGRRVRAAAIRGLKRSSPQPSQRSPA